MDYNGFEGVIPEGEYGGGTVMIWDRGTWEPEVPDVAAALAKGDLKFTTPRHEAARLLGARSHAQPPVAADQAPRSLRLDRRRDAEASALGRLPPDDGRHRARGRRHAAPAGAGARRRPAPRRSPHRPDVAARRACPSRVAPMLATLVDAPFHRPGWVWEEKYDGIRLVALQGGRARAPAHPQRQGPHRATSLTSPRRWPRCRRPRSCSTARSSSSTPAASRASSCCSAARPAATPPVYVAFDCLHARGRDLMRRAARRLAAPRWRPRSSRGRVLRVARRLAADGLQAFAEARRRGLEGVIGKDPTSTVPGREALTARGPR